MLLLQKNIEAKVEESSRICSVLPISTKELVVANSRSISLHSIQTNTILAETHLDKWPILNPQPHTTYTFIEVQYHPFLKILIALVFQLNEETSKKNWTIWKVEANESSISDPVILFNSKEHITKYDGMELKPRIIILPLDQYFVYLRQFYNDSQAVVLKGTEISQSFYLNEECLGSFDGAHQLVSFRSIISRNRINIQIFDISQNVKAGKNGTATIINVEHHGTGIVVGVKQLCQELILMAVNEKQNCMKYVLYNTELEDVIKVTHRDDARILKVFSIFNGMVLSLQQIGRDTVLCLEDTKMEVKQKKQETLQLEEWNLLQTKQGTLFCQYSQSPMRQQSVNVRLTRIGGAEQARLALYRQLSIPDSLIDRIWELTI